MVLKKMIPALVLGSIASLISCNSFTKVEAPQTIEYWQTNADETLKLQKQNNLVFDNPQNNFQNILINPSEKFQAVDGFGYLEIMLEDSETVKVVMGKYDHEILDEDLLK
jgi:glucosylceramidase